MNPFYSWLGFNFLSPPNDFDCANPPYPCIPIYLESSSIPMETYHYGVYQFTAEVYSFNNYQIIDRSTFYIDFRDTRYPGYPWLPVVGAATDIWIKYEAASNPKFYIRSEHPSIHDQNSNSLYEEAFEGDWIPIQNNQLLRIWEIKLPFTPQYHIPSTDFEDFWQNCLALISSQTGNFPRLVWGPIPNFDATSYLIYRAAGLPNNPPPLSSYSLEDYVDASTFEWTDYTVTIGGNSSMY